MTDERETLHRSALALDEIRENPPGRDASHLDDEYVSFRNEGADPLDLSGWTVENESGDRFQFPPGTILAPDTRVTIHSGRGTDTETDLHWRADEPVWHNTGDTVFVRDATGTLRLRESYNE